MPATSSYSINGMDIRRNKTCYASFMSPYDTLIQDKAFILIEKKKQEYFGVEKVRQYLRDLKSMGFEFTFKTVDGDIRVYPTKFIKRDAYNKMLCAAIRYLWEGKYQQTKTDRYYLFVEKYFEIKGKYNLNNLQTLCLAHNLVKMDLGRFMGFNGNHMWIYSGNSYCKLLSSLPTTEDSMNGYCTAQENHKTNDINELIELWKQ